MSNSRGSLLAQIEAGAVDPRVPLSSVLQNCIVLGGRAGSEKMREWARDELNGYSDPDRVPEYRRVPAALMAVITNRAGYNGVARRFDESVFPRQIRDALSDVDLEEAVFSHGIGQLEAMAREGSQDHQLIPPWSGVIAGFMNQQNMTPGGRVAEVFLSVSNVAVENVLVRIRTALSELVAELTALMPEGQDVPDRVAADQVIQYLITGDRSVINYAAPGGTIVTNSSGDGAGPVTVASGHGTAVGSQEASGDGASVVGSQSSSAGRDVVSAGRDATSPPAVEQPSQEGWWARLRKRGAVVAFATVVGAVAAVAGVVVAIALAAGWKP